MRENYVVFFNITFFLFKSLGKKGGWLVNHLEPLAQSIHKLSVDLHNLLRS